MLWRSEVRGSFGAFMTEDGNATAVRPFEDELMLINMSVWESVESLGDYVYRTDHAAYLRRRREWFERHQRSDRCFVVGSGRDIARLSPEAIERIDHLRANGPTPHAFTFRHPFSPDSQDLDRRRPQRMLGLRPSSQPIGSPRLDREWRVR